MHETIEIEVDCPHCLNANRAARRECRRYHGMCGGTGRVKKTVGAPQKPQTYTDEYGAINAVKESED